MSKPVTTDKWAGQFDCAACGKKRLMASAFSRRVLEKYRQSSDGSILKCQECTTKELQKERLAARNKASEQGSNDNNDEAGLEAEEQRVCASCQDSLSKSAYNRNQWNNKPPGVSRCRSCIETAESQESANRSTQQSQRLAEAQAKVEEALASGNKAQILQAESTLSALQAEKVTGLKPVRMGGGRGRGSNKGTSGGRFRGGRGRR